MGDRDARHQTTARHDLGQSAIGFLGLVPVGGVPAVAQIDPVEPLVWVEGGGALERFEGDKRRVADALGISRAKVYQRLKEWGLN